MAELRRPTQSAWAVNLLVREHGDLVGELLELGVVDAGGPGVARRRHPARAHPRAAAPGRPGHLGRGVGRRRRGADAERGLPASGRGHPPGGGRRRRARRGGAFRPAGAAAQLHGHGLAGRRPGDPGRGSARARARGRRRRPRRAVWSGRCERVAGLGRRSRGDCGSGRPRVRRRSGWPRNVAGSGNARGCRRSARPSSAPYGPPTPRWRGSSRTSPPRGRGWPGPRPSSSEATAKQQDVRGAAAGRRGGARRAVLTPPHDTPTRTARHAHSRRTTRPTRAARHADSPGVGEGQVRVTEGEAVEARRVRHAGALAGREDLRQRLQRYVEPPAAGHVPGAGGRVDEPQPPGVAGVGDVPGAPRHPGHHVGLDGAHGVAPGRDQRPGVRLVAGQPGEHGARPRGAADGRPALVVDGSDRRAGRAEGLGVPRPRGWGRR